MKVRTIHPAEAAPTYSVHRQAGRCDRADLDRRGIGTPKSSPRGRRLICLPASSQKRNITPGTSPAANAGLQIISG